METLDKLVKDWIKAEYHYRLGPFAFGTIAATRYLEAEAKLRHRLSGEFDLASAAKELGFAVERESLASRSRRRQIPRKRLVEKTAGFGL